MEVEIKVKIENLNSVERQLLDMGARKVREVIEEDEYFNHPCRDFSKTDEALRIRNDNTLTYKGPKVDTDTKSREEINIKIDNTNETKTLLEKLGFRFVAKVKKKRKYYKLEHITITLDDVEELGYFMEIECIGDYDPCRDKVLNLAKALNLQHFITRSYLEMILDKKSPKR